MKAEASGISVMRDAIRAKDEEIERLKQKIEFQAGYQTDEEAKLVAENERKDQRIRELEQRLAEK